MIRWFLERSLRKFEKQWGYDAAYQHELLQLNWKSFLKYGLGVKAMDYSAAPPEAMFAASLYTVMTEDCGPCTQIGVDIALASGVPEHVVRAALAGDEQGMGETAALAWRFARASLARDIEADVYREEIERRWGRKAVAALGLAMVAARSYPTLKYAMGYGKACSRILVDGQPAALTRLAA
jgi:hypothetical protein